jgi:hypothetical protein
MKMAVLRTVVGEDDLPESKSSRDSTDSLNTAL